MSNALEQVIELAASRIGYLEKSKSAYQINPKVVYEMTDGAGRDNYTECWEDTKPIQYDGIGQGGAWCCNFVYWLFYKLFGKDKAAEALYLNDWKGSEPWQYFSCYAWAGNFESHGQRYQSSKCQKGDIIYFTKSHTGIVYMTDDTYVYTIEGNTSSGSDVIANGGSVQKKKYKRGIDAIYCYGRPNYDVLEAVEPTPTAEDYMPTLSVGMKDLTAIKTFQILMRHYGYYTMDIDGSYGNGSKSACQLWQSSHGLDADGICGPLTWAKLLK